MTTGKLRGAILAAGKGARMQPFSQRFPKPLLPVGNKPLIVHQIEFMASLGIEDIVVLIGHKGYEIARVLGDGERYGVSIRYVEQSQMLGIGHAVGLLEAEIGNDPFLLFLGDIYFVPSNFPQLLSLYKEQGGGAVLATREDEPDKIRLNFAILQKPDGYVSRVIEKPRHAPNRLKGVGVYLFEATIFDAIRRTPRTALRDEYELTDAIQVLIDDGYPVRPANVIEKDINLTAPADLLRANMLHVHKNHTAPAISDDVRLHPGARIYNSIIGAGAEVVQPIEIANSLVFAGTRVESSVSLDRAIVTPHGLLDCRPFIEETETAAYRNAVA